jgi:hypothetical protein
MCVEFFKMFLMSFLTLADRLCCAWFMYPILCWCRYPTRVEAGSNTSTVTLRVVGGDEKGSLKSETVKYGLMSQGTGTRERLRWQGPAAHTKDSPNLSSERAPYKNKTVTVTQVIKIWSWAPDGTRCWLTVSRNVTLTLTWCRCPEIGTSFIDLAQLNRLSPEDGDRIQSPKRCVF